MYIAHSQANPVFLIDPPRQNIPLHLDETMSFRQSKCGSRSSRITQDPEIQGVIIRACLDRKTEVTDDEFYSSNPSSSDSSSGGFSSSDTESKFGARSRLTSFAQPPVRLEKQSRTEKKMAEERQRTLFQVFHRYPSMNEATAAQFHRDECIVKSKSRALKIYANLKKLKQPISPGARLSSFINSLFASGNAKKPKRSEGSGHVSSCSSAASFSRSCLSKNRPDTKDGGKRTVRFHPVDENQKCLHGQDRHHRTGRKPEKQTPEEDVGRNAAAAREFLQDYRLNQRPVYRAHEDDDDDDVSSCSSSDLFELELELDHLAVAGNDIRYGDDLPVYETTRVTRNLAIANGF
ncbi:hypothetical protein SAY87_023225 [Trapa incisa]|uniref:Protein BIG GRAIN 1-like B n=1 Tax=Trapa incisa TaxID=236973 RepID=A0AAN7K7T8_9MYRT|nr:hypothetical protein SAY87_023225 [Trapa incisa]